MKTLTTIIFILITQAALSQNLEQLYQKKYSKNEKKFIDRVVAVVNGEIITLSEVREKIIERRIKDSLDLFNYPETLVHECLNELVEKRLLAFTARKEDTKVSQEQIDSEVDKLMENLYKKYPDREKLNKALAEDNLSVGKLRDILNRKIETNLLIENFIWKKITYTDKEIEEFAEKQQKSGKPKSRYMLSHILIKCPDNADNTTALEKEKTALKIFYEYKEQGKTFSELAKIYSEDGATKNNNGELGIINEGEFLPEIENKIKMMQIGDVAGPIRTKSGFHIIYLQNRETLKDIFLFKKFEDESEKLVKQLKSEAQIKILLEN